MPRRTLHDPYFKRAKREGFLARSAYKLVQIQEAQRLLRAGDRVVDLGCAPGAWLQVASEIVGPRGLVVGVDLKPVQHSMPPNVRHLVADVFEIEPDAMIQQAGGRFRAVLSDMAPDTTGHGDHERSVRLCRRVLELLPAILEPGGGLAMKVFEGGTYPELLRDTGASFDRSKGYKPAASRDVSREMYIVARGFRLPGL